jgi:hypothetical protein
MPVPYRRSSNPAWRRRGGEREPLSESAPNPPPEPGLARREAHGREENVRSENGVAGSAPRLNHHTAREEGAHEGTRGSLVMASEAPPDVRVAPELGEAFQVSGSQRLEPNDPVLHEARGYRYVRED